MSAWPDSSHSSVAGFRSAFAGCKTTRYHVRNRKPLSPLFLQGDAALCFTIIALGTENDD